MTMSAPQTAPLEPAVPLSTRWRFSLRRLLLLTFAVAVALAYTGRQPLAWLAPQVLGVVLLCIAAIEQMLAIGRAIKDREPPAEARPALVAAIAARAFFIAIIAAYWITRYPSRQRVSLRGPFDDAWEILPQLWPVLYYLCVCLLIHSLLPLRLAKPAPPRRAWMDAIAWPIAIAACSIIWAEQCAIPVLVGYAVDAVELAQPVRFFSPLPQSSPSFNTVAAALALAGANVLLCRKLLGSSGNRQRLILAAWLLTWIVALALLPAIARDVAEFLPGVIISSLFLWPARTWLLAAALVAVTCTVVAFRWVPPARSYEIRSTATFPLFGALAYAAGLVIELWLSVVLTWTGFYSLEWVYTLTMPQAAMMAAALLLALHGIVQHLRSRSQPSVLAINAYPALRVAAGAILVLASLLILVPTITAFGCALWYANV